MKHGRTLSDSTSGQGPRVRWAVDGVRISGSHPPTRCMQKESARNDQMPPYEIIAGTCRVKKRAICIEILPLRPRCHPGM